MTNFLSPKGPVAVVAKVRLTLTGTVACDNDTLPDVDQWRWLDSAAVSPDCDCDASKPFTRCHSCWLEDAMTDSESVQDQVDAYPIGSTLTMVGHMTCESLGWYDGCEEFEELFVIESVEVVK